MGTRFISTLTTVPSAIGELLEKYSNIPQDQQVQHILTVRNDAWEAKQYPCLGRFRFLELDLSTHPLYTQYVLPTLTNPHADPEPLFLDIGTCLGQDIRKLVYDGVPVSRLRGGDVIEDFIDAGYSLFHDEHTIPRSNFICPADVFDSDPHSQLASLDGRVTILHATAVFHLFDMDQQKRMADRCLRLLRRDAGKVLIFGAQSADVNAGDVPRANGSSRWRHNSESWEAMWKEVCGQPAWKDTVKAVDVHSVMAKRRLLNADLASAGDNDRSVDSRWMTFEVWITF